MAQFLIVRDRLLRALGAIDYQQRVDHHHRCRTRQPAPDRQRRGLPRPRRARRRQRPLLGAHRRPASSRRRWPACASRICSPARRGWTAALRSEHLWENPAHLLGALLYLAETQRRKNVVVLMPYSDRLHAFARWFAQLWAESLAKASDLEGNPTHSGQTPLPAVGATDQHSQLQLFLDGPPDKVVMFIRVEDHGREIEIPQRLRRPRGRRLPERQGPRRAAQHGAARHRAGAAEARPHGADAVAAAAQRLHARAALLPVRGGDGLRRRAAPGRTAGISRRPRRGGG